VLLRCAKWGLAGLAVVATLALAPAASAHSTLLGTEPARDGIVQHSPKRVLLRFGEPVETELGSITVYDGEGERVDAGKILRPEPESVAVAIDRELERGTYTVAWRVISADSDPIKGAWVFHVKEPGAQPGGIAAQVLEDTPVRHFGALSRRARARLRPDAGVRGRRGRVGVRAELGVGGGAAPAAGGSGGTGWSAGAGFAG